VFWVRIELYQRQVGNNAEREVAVTKAVKYAFHRHFDERFNALRDALDGAENRCLQRIGNGAYTFASLYLGDGGAGVLRFSMVFSFSGVMAMPISPSVSRTRSSLSVEVSTSRPSNTTVAWYFSARRS